MGRIIAIDFGLKRSGIAMTDELNLIASPLETVDSKLLMQHLHKLTLQYKIDVFVLGYPKKMDNSDTHISENVRMLYRVLVDTFNDVKVVLYDERFTSKMASQAISTGAINKKQKMDKSLIDQVSAAILLQSYMSALDLGR